MALFAQSPLAPLVTFLIPGSVPSGKNSRLRLKSGRYLPTKAVRTFYQEVHAGLLPIHRHRLAVLVAMTAEIQIPGDHKPDLDNQLTTLCDALVHAGILADDHLIDTLIASRRAGSPAQSTIRLYPSPYPLPTLSSPWIQMTIPGQIPSGKNSRRTTKQGQFIKSDAVMRYLSDFVHQIQLAARRKLARPCALVAHVTNSDHRIRDLDNQLATLCDALALGFVLENDAWIDQIAITRSIGHTPSVSLSIGAPAEALLSRSYTRAVPLNTASCREVQQPHATL